MKSYLSLFFIILFLQACSVRTAMKGRELPDLSSIYIGADHGVIDKTLGHPEKVMVISNGKRLHIYANLAGLEPNMVDFAPNLIMDIATLGLWEFVPYHSRKLKYYYITYDDNDKVDSIDRYIDRNRG